MTPQEIRSLRLKNDYEEMVNIKGAIIDWKAVRGNPPYVEEYELTVNVNGIISDVPAYRSQHIIKLVLPADYPNKPPEIHMLSIPFVFHPNWYVVGRWCYGKWLMPEGLGHHVLRMIRTIQYDSEITNENSAANIEANKWYLSKRNSRLFPCDRKVLPDPTKKRFEINEGTKKKFIIK
jgi:ubiquitin-protein ligase